MAAHLKRRGTGASRAGEAGFSIIEFLMTAIVLGVGLLGLALLQSTAIHSYGNSRSRTTATGIGQSILETIDAEARQQRLFRTISPGAIAPALSAYFTASPVAGSYNTYGTAVNAKAMDPLERVQVYATNTVLTTDNTGGTVSSGTVYTFVVTVQYTDTVAASGAVVRSLVFRRKVTI